MRQESMKKKKQISLRSGLVTTVLLCWMLPMIFMLMMGVILLGRSYRKSARESVDADATLVMQQIQMDLEDVIDDSKSVSYDGDVRQAYRTYVENSNGAELYRTVDDYLNKKFVRDSKYEGVFITFWNDRESMSPHVISNGTANHLILKSYLGSMNKIIDIMSRKDTQNYFLTLDGRFYMCRNLMDGFVPYATVSCMIDTDRLLLPMKSIHRFDSAGLTLDNCSFTLDSEGNFTAQETVYGSGEELTPAAEDDSGEELTPAAEDDSGEEQTSAAGSTPLPADGLQEEGSCSFVHRDSQNEYRYTAVADGHPLVLILMPEEYHVLKENPWFGGGAACIALMVVPLLYLTISMFRRHVSVPLDILTKASSHIQDRGQEGYQIESTAPNREFQSLYDHYNSMSRELKNQFERTVLAQQATQEAKMKALQSQINPHFLNNTLEIINWQVRLAGDDPAAAMIEALSTMLNAALDRDGRVQVTLQEEMSYVDAYLYIIRQRMGEGLHISKDIPGELLEIKVPRLVLQPVVENAVEHDLSARHGGNLWIRAKEECGHIVLEVEHDGTLTLEDKEKIEHLIRPDPKEERCVTGRVGIQNVSQRLKILYGDQAEIEIRQTTHGTILARITLPGT